MLSANKTAREFSYVQVIAYAAIESPVMFALLTPGTTVTSWAVFIGGTLLAGAATVALQRGAARLLSSVIGSATGMSGGGGATTSVFAMSQVQSLIVRERWDEAVAQLQAASRVHKGETGAIISQQLGDLLSFRLHQHEEAVRSYRKARDAWATVTGIRGEEGVAYCTRRLIDLYEDALNNHGAAERERARLHA
jgi:hypothetical protein